MSRMIETARLRLSPYTEADADALLLNAGPPEVARMMASIPLPFTREAALARIKERRCGPDAFTFAIRERGTGEAIGEIGAGKSSPEGIASMQYFLRPDFWGRGLASEAVEAGLSHAFETLGWTEIEATTFDDNPGSVRVLKKAGFVMIGPSDCASRARPEGGSSTLHRLSAKDWKANR